MDAHANMGRATMEQHRNIGARRSAPALGALMLVLLVVCACTVNRAGTGNPGADGSVVADSGRGGIPDLGGLDLGAPTVDAGVDAGPAPVDLGPPDLGVDFGVDLGPRPPCGGACTADQACVLGTCVTCGQNRSPCCEASRCMTGLVCALVIGCTPCGAMYQPCCAGNVCNGSLSCTGVCL